MKILAWDTSSKTGSIVAVESVTEKTPGGRHEGLRLVAELTLNVDNAHSAQLLWGIHQVLHAAQWKIEDVSFFGVGVGPGSFTGLRIGITTARTLAHTLDKPLIGVSSLAALARPIAERFAHESDPPLVIVVTDACKGELYCLWGDAHSLQRCAVAATDLGDPSHSLWDHAVHEEVLTPDALVERLLGKQLEKISQASSEKRASPWRWIAVGEGRNRYPDIWKKLPKDLEIRNHSLSSTYESQTGAIIMQGRALGQLVWEACQAGLAQESLSVLPRYLRASDAELKLKAGLHGKKLTKA
jgi:tRNA threonylcarbamoyl adenosine modification protein YeaZ